MISSYDFRWDKLPFEKIRESLRTSIGDVFGELGASVPGRVVNAVSFGDWFIRLKIGEAAGDT